MFKEGNKVSMGIKVSKINRGYGVLIVLGHVHGKYSSQMEWEKWDKPSP